MKVQRALLVVKRTSFSLLKSGKKRGAEARMRRLIDDDHESTASMKLAHEEHTASVHIVRRELKRRGIEVRERTIGLERVVRNYDLVITVGGDGTLLDASHFVRGKTPVLGVNSAPTFSVGFLTGCRAPTFTQTLDALIEDRLEPMPVHRLQVSIDRKRLPEPVLNDVLFCADNPAVTTRYTLATPVGEESHRSSGIWISTAAGSTAALRSAGGEALSLESDRFAFVVREAYAPPGSEVRIKGGVLERNQSLTVECLIAQASIYIDGSYRRYSVHFGQRVAFRLHQEPLRLVRPVQGRGHVVRGL
jgi:NAD+ kinase